MYSKAFQAIPPIYLALVLLFSPLAHADQIIFFEDFEDGMPADWEVMDNLGDGGVWVDDNPGQRGPYEYSQSPFMVADSWYFAEVPFDTSLISPGVDCSTADHVALVFSQYYYNYQNQTAEISIGTPDKGWTQIACYEDQEQEDGRYVFDISDLAAHQTEVQIRFDFSTNSEVDLTYWVVDDVSLQERTDVFTESFEAGLPDDWEVVDHSGSGGLWVDDNPSGRGPYESLTEPFVSADSQYFSTVAFNTSLMSPPIDCRGVENVHFRFGNDYWNYYDQQALIYVSIDEKTWHELDDYHTSWLDCVKHYDLSLIADGEPNVRLRFFFGTDGTMERMYWNVDDMIISGLASGADDDDDDNNDDDDDNDDNNDDTSDDDDTSIDDDNNNDNDSADDDSSPSDDDLNDDDLSPADDDEDDITREGSPQEGDACGC